MNWFFIFLTVLGTFVLMEVVAWLAHKYVMHGFLWALHKDHHTGAEGFFQKNDWFFLIFAIPSWLCIMLGMMYGYPFPVWVGAGIAVYGAAYFFVHELFIHQRVKVLSKTQNPYLLAIRRAHKTHHKSLVKEGGECFGMLFVPMRFFKAYKEIKNGL
jgi:beta-carotene 3-hydroxylase